MAAKKATKKAAPKKTAAKKKTTSKKETKTVKAAKTKDVDVETVENGEETPSTLTTAAEKAPAKKKRMTKKQLADQTERNELTEKWAKLKEIDHEVKPQKYRMSESYEPNTPIEHPLFGWGFILSLNNNRLEVLFESGIKMLVSNFKG